MDIRTLLTRAAVGLLLPGLAGCYASHEADVARAAPCVVRTWMCGGALWAGSTPAHPTPLPCFGNVRDRVGGGCRGRAVDVVTPEGRVYVGTLYYSPRHRRALVRRSLQQIYWYMEGDDFVIEQGREIQNFVPEGTTGRLPVSTCDGDEFRDFGHLMNVFTGYERRFSDCRDLNPELEDGVMAAMQEYSDGDADAGVVFDY